MSKETKTVKGKSNAEILAIQKAQSKPKPKQEREKKELNWLNEDVIYRTDGYNYDESTEALWEKLCQESKASDFYVHVSQADEFIEISVCPVLWFDKNKFALDVTPQIQHLWPDYVSGEVQESIMEAGYAAPGHGVAEVTQDLTQRGFVINANFSSFIEENQ